MTTSSTVRASVANGAGPAVNTWTEWVPDPFDWADFATAPVLSTDLRLRWGDLPLPRRRRLTATILTSEARVELALAAGDLAEDLPDLPLDVHGFRRPFSSAGDEVTELERFNASCRTMAEEWPWVVVTDIEDCFANILLSRLEEVLRSFGSSSCSIRRLLSGLQSQGVATLPRDYVEFRFLSNLYLRLVDEDIREPFVRYADDYRIYCSTRGDAERALSHVTSALRRSGFRPNSAKTFVARATDPQVSMKALSFRPIVAAILRGTDPLATLRDGEWSFLKAHLSPSSPFRSIDKPVMRPDQGFDGWVDAALAARQSWLLARLLSPTRASGGLSSDVAGRLSAYCEHPGAASIRGLALAALARTGHLDQVRAIRRQGLDSRFELLACAVLGESIPSRLVRRWPGLDEALVARSLSSLSQT